MQIPMPRPPRPPHDAMATACAARLRRLARLLLAALAVCVAAACSRQPAMDASQIPHTEIPKTEATLQVAQDGQAVRYAGAVADEATRAALVRSLQAAYGSRASGEIRIEPDTHAPPWTGGLDALLGAFRLSGATLDLRGKHITLGGAASGEDRANLLKTTRRLYPGYTLAGLFEGVDLKQALPDAGDTAALVEFLNAVPIRFEDDSGMVTAASRDGLARAARALKAADRQMRLEAGVRAEPGQSPDNGLDIAAQRAEAVRLQLAIRGVNPLAIQPRVLPASPGKGGQVEFSALPAAPVAAQAAASPGATAPAADDANAAATPAAPRSAAAPTR